MHKHFTAGRQYLAEVADTLEPLLAGGRTPEVTSVVVLRRIARATVRRLRVTATLMHPDSIGEAAVLARTLIEGAVSCGYIVAPASTAEREERAERYSAFEVVHQQLRLEDYFRLFPDDASVPANMQMHRTVLTQGRDSASQRFAKIEKHFLGWTGKRLQMLKEDIIASRPGWPIEEVMLDYTHFSAFVHATALSVSVGLQEAQDYGELLAADVAFSAGLASAVACDTVADVSGCGRPNYGALLRRLGALFEVER